MKQKSDNPMLKSPLDELFDTPQEQEHENEIQTYDQVTEGELAEMVEPPEPEVKDEEDVAIDEKIDAIYDAALETFHAQTEYIQIIEPRYAARTAEVAASYLAIALNAAATRAKVKGERKRQAAFVPFANKSQNNVVVASREEIMRMISIDADVKEIK